MKPAEEAKEISLFGEKSIREEAYHQKILHLEKEIARLEALAKDLNSENLQPKTGQVHLEGLYYESLLSFDKRVKKEQEFIEKRAAEIAERLEVQAQRLIFNLESYFRRKIKWLGAALFILLGLIIFFFFTPSLFYGPKPQEASLLQNKGYATDSESLQRRAYYIKTALQNQTIYRNHYEVKYLDLLDGSYVIEIELNISPADKWFLKNLCSDLVRVFQRYAASTSAEFSFLYEGKLYLKAYVTQTPQKVRLQYFY